MEDGRRSRAGPAATGLSQRPTAGTCGTPRASGRDSRLPISEGKLPPPPFIALGFERSAPAAACSYLCSRARRKRAADGRAAHAEPCGRSRRVAPHRTAPRPRDYARLPPPFVTRLPEPFSTPPRPLSPPRGAPRRRSGSAAAPGGRGLALRALRRRVREAARREAERLAPGSCEEEGGGSAVPGCIKTSLPRARC